jgi:hypothetical protein
MNKVYLFHIYGPSSENHYKEHADNIRRLNPEKIFIWGDTEYCVDFILREFIKDITPWLEENNKAITIIGVGFNRKITANIVVDCGPGYYTTTYPTMTSLHGDKTFDDVIINSDKLFTLYINRGSPDRVAMLDTVAREKMLDDGIVTFHGAFSDEEQFNWQYHDGSHLVD